MINLLHSAYHVNKGAPYNMDDVKFFDVFVNAYFNRKSKNCRGCLHSYISVMYRTGRRIPLTVGGPMSLSLLNTTVSTLE